MRFLILFCFLFIGHAKAYMSDLARAQLVPVIDHLSFGEMKFILEGHENLFRSKLKDTDIRPIRSGFTQYTLRDKKTAMVFIFIPGLYRVPSQFRYIKELIEPYQQNAIYLNLPGHGMDMYSANNIAYTDWILAVDRAVNVAKQLGEKIVFVGQSTGGALSVLHAINHPENVAGLFLIEPAIKVRPALAKFTCVFHRMIKQLNFIYEFAGRDDDPKELPYMSTKVGCEVDKILNSSRQVFTGISVPIFVLNNLGDKIVSTNRIAQFAEQVSGPMTYVEIPKEGSSYHGDADFMYGVILKHQAEFKEFLRSI